MRTFEHEGWKVVDRVIPVLKPLEDGWSLPDPKYVSIESERQVIAVWGGYEWPSNEDIHKLEYEIMKRLNCRSDEIYLKALWPRPGDKIRGMSIL